jgi:hypothetical protein
MRLMNLLRRDAVAADALIEKIFSSQSSRKHKGQKAQALDERLRRQQALITFMSNQLEELKAARGIDRVDAVETRTTAAKRAVESEVSKGTKSAYLDMLAMAVPGLVKNSELVEKREAGKDHKGLRASVIRFLKADESASDAELASSLLGE